MPVPRPMAPHAATPFLARRQQRCQPGGDDLARGRPDGEEDLGDPEQPHHDRNEAHAVVEARDAKRESRRATHRVDADHGNQQPEHGHGEAGRQRASGKAGHEAEAHQHEREELRRAEAQCHARERRRDHDQRDSGGDAADERSDGGNPECGAAAPLLGHLMAVEAGHDRSGLPGHVDQYRGDGAAVHGAVVDRRQHDQGAGRVEPEGERNEDGGARCRPEPRQHADQCSKDAADQRKERGFANPSLPPGRSSGAAGCPPPTPQIPSAPIGSGTLSQ